jgi:hypothetical protein
MPARVIIWLILIVIAAAGLTIGAAQIFGVPLAALGLTFAGGALAFRLWIERK